MKKKIISILSLAVISVLCGNAFADDNLIIRWNNALLQAVRETKMGPPMVARAIAITHTCIFDAWAAYDAQAKGTRLGARLRQPKGRRTIKNKQEAVSFAAYRALSDLFPAKQAEFSSLMTTLGYDPSNSSADTSTAAGVGNTACNAVLQFRHADGSNQLGDLHPGSYSDYTGYQPVNSPDVLVSPNHWQPLMVTNAQGITAKQSFMVPQWYLVKPFAMKKGSEFRPEVRPYRYRPNISRKNKKGREENAEYRKQADQLVRISARLTDRKKMISEYWSDGPSSETPPGHWCLLSQTVSHRDRHGIDQDVKMFFVLGNALMDASIAAWDSKRAFDYVRPVTAVRYLNNGKMIRAWAGPYQGTRLVRGETWLPYQPSTTVTPPFPECVSGHSTFSSAAAAALRMFTGSDEFKTGVTLPAGSSKLESGTVPARNITLKWNTFTEAARQAGVSRMYGGIHFSMGNEDGWDMGQKIGLKAWKKASGYFE